MIDKLRLAVGIVVAVMIISGLIAFLSTPTKQARYTIQIPHNRDYQTNNYTSNGNCITFKNECGCKKDDIVTVCGNYTIITNKK